MLRATVALLTIAVAYAPGAAVLEGLSFDAEAKARAHDRYRHVHIPKIAGTAFRGMAETLLPHGSTLATAEKCYCTKPALDDAAPVITFVRAPVAHVLSQFMMCKYSAWGRTHADAPPLDEDDAAGLARWLARATSDPGAETCYDPFNMQTRYLTCRNERFSRSFNPRDGHLRVPGYDGMLADASARLAAFHFVGVAELYHESACVFEYWILGKVRHGCDCEHRRFPISKAARSHKRHAVPPYNGSSFPTAAILPLVDLDHELYAVGFARFLELVGHVEARSKVKVLCPGAIPEAARAALARTARGAAVLADAAGGARDPGGADLLPTRGAPPPPVAPACDFAGAPAG